MRPVPRHSARARRRGPLSLLSAMGAALLVTAGAFAGVIGVTSPASAAASVSVSGTPDADGESRLELSGSGFQSVQGGFGGIYVLFGWVEPGGDWRPSNGGKTGDDYRYVYDDETKPAGFQLFVTFPGSSTASAANGGEVASDGSWSGTIRVPGSRFTTFDRSQNETTVDCTEVQCGIITIGAHGVVNAGNETFTPVDFPAAASAADDGGAEEDGEGSDAGESDEADDSGSESGDDAAEAPADSQDAPAPASEGTADQAVPSVDTPLIDPQLLADQQRQQTLLTLLVAVGIVLALCVFALSFGIGGYLAMKALLLGVNPEALEKVRQKREERAVRAEHRRRRKVSDLRRREEIRSQRAEARNDGLTDRAAMGSAGTGKHAAGTPAGEARRDHQAAVWGDYNPTPKGATSPPTNESYGAGSDALMKFFEDESANAAQQKQNASTIVLDRVADEEGSK
ncbi:MAG: hypothetical protein ACTHVY_13115 [Brevibacterium yomogidense]|uniref:hypothetical protein n=1 Tax=Brevibacterium sp. Mu109 TaxID=1255669 RepID=UPI000C3AA5E0|nr:hypothetical protein [Brevibacterium sp. Mu109]SMY01126.1 hypothetical protein BSP109_03260 [Brevibacterium sp. Mu109]